MTERLLQYIWQFKYYHTEDLTTTEGLRVQVLHPGTLNSNQGPDFLNARLRIGQTIWVGSVEIHILASEWMDHNHGSDANYKNVILHVVFKEDRTLQMPIPTLVLEDRVSKLMLARYEALMRSSCFIPCEKHITAAAAIAIRHWQERMLVERLQQRCILIMELLGSNHQNWEETFWWMLARNFGLKVNSDSFEKIAQSIPLKILARHKNQIHQLEALLLGQAGILDKKFNEAYPNMLRKEYQFLQKKYCLQKVHYPLYFLRMRPANFPTVRLAQLAAVIHTNHLLFSTVVSAKHIADLEAPFQVVANDYWHYHYLFDEQTKFSKKNIGKQMVENILINSCIPIVYAYGYYHNNNALQEKAIEWMREIPPEKNAITQGFQNLGICNTNAHESQALVHLKNNYCNLKACLVCGIGNAILKSEE